MPDPFPCASCARHSRRWAQQRHQGDTRALPLPLSLLRSCVRLSLLKKMCSAYSRGMQRRRRWLTAVVCLLAVATRAEGSSRISTQQLYAMLDGLRGELVGKYMCSVAGGGDLDLCRGLGLDKSRAASAQDMMRQFALPSSGRTLYEEQIIRGEATARQLADGMSSLTAVPDLLLDAAAAIEATYAEPVPDDIIANMQVPPALAAAPQGFLKDVPVNYGPLYLSGTRALCLPAHAANASRGGARDRVSVVQFRLNGLGCMHFRCVWNAPAARNGGHRLHGYDEKLI